MKTLPLLSMSFVVVGCTINHDGLNPTELQEYIAMTDAKATVKALDVNKKSVAVTPQLHAKPQESSNNLYQADGAIIYQGLPAAETQILLVEPDGGVVSVNNFNSNPYGTYIVFTPEAIYNINRATGETVKYPRVDTVTIAPNAAPILPGQPFP